MVNKITGLSKGYGFVSFAHTPDAQTAIEALDGFRVSFICYLIQLLIINQVFIFKLIVREKAPESSIKAIAR
jgi:RNA recognition motif-containing protein